MEHPAVFPVLLAREIIEAFSDSRQMVFEPMAGSGSTIIAAAQVERKCFAMEIDPKYCDVAVKRWMNLTGKMAYNQDGVCFPS